MTSARRWVGGIAVALAAIGAAGLNAKAQASAVPASDSASSARDISGLWQGTFRLDSAWKLPQQPSARAIGARVRFNPVGDASPTTSSARSVHSGTFEIEFERFGFELATSEALGWSVGTDSMRATLNPTVDHGFVELRGTFRGDAIVGTWRFVSDPGGANGQFELRKAGR